MRFNYDDYLSRNFLIPIVMMSVATFTTIFLVISLIKNFEIEKCLGFIIIIIFYTVSISWFKRGVYLFKEKEHHAIEITGRIDNITDVFESPRYYYNKKIVRAKIVTIEGKKFYFMTTGDLGVSDIVRIKYLPKSTFVLEVDSQE